MNLTKLVAAAMGLGLLVVGGAASNAAEEIHAPPRHFLVLMRMGPAYDSSLPILGQKGFPAHAAYMSDLERKGQLAFGGPLLEDFASMQPTGAVLVIRAETADAARQIAAADPSGLLEVEAVRAFLLSAGSK